MSVKPNDLLELVLTLFDDNSESSNRNVAVQAYYSCYHKALVEAENRLFLDIDKNNPSVHARLIDAYSDSQPKDKSQVKLKKEIVRKLKVIKKLRQNASYEIEQNFHKNDTIKSMNLAKEIFNDIGNFDV